MGDGHEHSREHHGCHHSHHPQGHDCEGRHHHHHDGEGGGDARGPGARDTEFLDLEISQVLLGEARRAARGVAVELMQEALRERLRERLGERLAAIGRLAADILADDVEANLAVESTIGARRERGREIEERLRAAVGASGAEPSPGGGERAGGSTRKAQRRRGR
ncbi:MAG: hypothetical protein OZ921_17595 [Sorangiineae bacterium]|nr:hypothetical protein [Polyangiaceae bacterium]MEB2324333.1 hypothetical protein [Sorangiineae bacterium]